ncbi:MAG TPA: zinc ABC transporter substrate-binding protein [Streptosporangiaceae bacterium]|nr:zinc ABC transporter substrate-binding protein [Streptosporangiaceae bacterium]
MRWQAARIAGAVVLAAAVAAATTACSAAAIDPPGEASGSSSAGAIVAIGAENQYADVIGQVGGRYVNATAIMSNPNNDPHTFEASPRVAQEVGGAQLVVQNGLGYDGFMNTIENAAPSGSRKVIDVQRLLGLPDSTPNPHLWYKPGTMAAVATAIAADLTAIEPAHGAYFKTNAAAFAGKLAAWTDALSAFKTKYPETAVATTEPVADYMLQAAGTVNLTPWSFQAAIMNGNDPSPQDLAIVQRLFTGRKVKAFLYNQQVTDSLTESFITLAHQNGIPVVGVYETMPTPGYDYQSWMLAEVTALTNAVATKKSTEHL